MEGQVLRFTTSVAAGATSANVVQGSLVQYPGRDSMVQVAATIPAAAAGTILMTVKLGGRVVAPDQVVPIESAAGRGPDSQLGWLVSAPARGSDLIELTYRSTNAGAVVVTSLVSVVPV